MSTRKRMAGKERDNILPLSHALLLLEIKLPWHLDLHKEKMSFVASREEIAMCS